MYKGQYEGAVPQTGMLEYYFTLKSSRIVKFQLSETGAFTLDTFFPLEVLLY